MENILQPLEKVLCIHHPPYLKNDLYKTKTLIDLDKEINDMTLAYAIILGLKV